MPRYDAAYLDPADPRLTTGTPQEQERARREFARQREVRDIVRTVDREIPRSDLIFGRRWVEVASTGELFNPWFGDVWFVPEGVVYYMDESGFPRLLEPANPPSRAELQRRQAAKEQRRADRAAASKARNEERRRALRLRSTSTRRGSCRLGSREFHDKSLEIERTSKTKPEIWIDHDRDLRIGNVVMLYTSRDWWMCDFFLNRDFPDDIVFEVGQPVSVGLSFLKIGSGAPYLREVSIVRRGAVEGAEITSRSELKPPKPAPVKPAATTTPRSRPLSPVAAAPPVVYRTPKANRDIIETAELRRRHDWLLDNGYRVSFEEVLDNLKSEVGYGRDLGLEWHNKHRRSA